MKKISILLFIFSLAAGCSSPPPVIEEQSTLVATVTPQPTVTPEVLATEPIQMTENLTDTPQQTETVELDSGIDFSTVTLYEATFLMDPQYFQVSLDNWPEQVPDHIVLSVDGEPYTCEELFPEDFPNRIYCFGPAPRKGDQVSVIVTGPESDTPLLEIPFVVPAPGG